jgi:hypothetical protein
VVAGLLLIAMGLGAQAEIPSKPAMRISEKRKVVASRRTGRQAGAMPFMIDFCIKEDK